jgi:hypothetical protein
VGRRGRIFVALTLLVASAALVGTAARYQAAAAAAVPAAQPRTPLDRISSRIAGKPVRARCGGARQWNAVGEGVLGYAVVGGDLSTLAPRVCSRLRAMEAGARPVDLLISGAALVTVAHEAEHLHGIANEAVAECYAIQRAPSVARALHIDAGYAALAVRMYWDAYPERPPAYRSTECYDGGPLDLAPAKPGWP